MNDEIRIEVIKTRVTAKSRSLRAGWSHETVNVMVSAMEELKELMRTVGFQGFLLTETESNVVMDIMFSPAEISEHFRHNVQRLIDNQLLNCREFQDDQDADSGIVMVSATDLLEQEFQLLENYRNL